MNAFLRKEIRLLLPSFLTALALSFTVWLIPRDSTSVSSWQAALDLFPFLLCPAMLVMTALDSFGREVGSGTFSNLLAQPISRPRIWATKTALLGAAIGIVFCSWWLSFLLHVRPTMWNPNPYDIATGTAIFALAVFAGGQWTVLLFRQVAAAFWVTLIVPGALAMAVAGLTTKHPERTEPVMLVVLSIYVVAGVLLSRRLFLRAQDVSWTGGNITMPEVRGLRGWFAERLSHRRWRPRAALFAKEFQLHQSLLVVAGVLALLHLALIVIRPAPGNLNDLSALEFVGNQFWVLWPAMMPLLIGCAAVAEERKLGTLEAQLCLPVRRRTQFAIKFAVALGLVILLGVLIPVLLESRRFLSELNGELIPGQFLRMLLIPVGLVAVSFYASTLVRNTLQAFAPAVLGILLAWVLLFGAMGIGYVSHLWRGWLIHLLGVPALTLTLVALAYWNFKRVLVGWPVWRRNLFTFLAVLASVMTLTSLIYNRVWELLSPIEPAHGTARLAAAQAVTMRNEGDHLIVQLPDGRISTDLLWTDLLVPARAMMTGGRFLEASNWMSISFWNRDVAAVQKDGSLWTTAQPDDYERYWRQGRATNSDPIKLVQLDAGTDWKSVADRFALKTDGTLWRLGGGRINTRTNWPGFRAFAPVRLGADSDWAELQSSEWLSPAVLRKTDGRAWVNIVNRSDHKAEVLRFDEETAITRSPLHDGPGWHGVVWAVCPGVSSFQVGVRKDGTFRVCNVWRSPTKNGSVPWELVNFDLQLGKDSDWRGLAGDNGMVATLKADGSLWRWDFPTDPVARPDTARAIRLGTHSDWVAVARGRNGMISLAADGSLWLWRITSQELSRADHGIQPLLAASRKPQLIGNVFGKVE